MRTERNRRIIRAARLAIIINCVLLGGKIAAGVVTASVGILSEAAHSGVDLLAAMFAWAAIHFALRPADESHPYGHGKVEALTSFAEGLLIFGVVAGIVWRAVSSLRGGVVVEQVGVGLAVMAGAAVVSGLLSRYLLRVARREASPALDAMGTEMSADVVSAVGVIVGLVLVRFTGWAAWDAIVGLVVAAVLVRAGVRVIIGAVRGLTDSQLPTEEVDTIRDVLNAHADNFLEYHALRTRHVGGAHAIDLHLVVPHDMSVGAAHALSSHLEDEIAAALPLTDVTIHMEPEDEAQKAGFAAETQRAQGNTK